MAISVARLSGCSSPERQNPIQSARIRASLAARRYEARLHRKRGLCDVLPQPCILLPLGQRSLGTVVSADHSQHMHDLAVPIRTIWPVQTQASNHAVASS